MHPKGKKFWIVDVNVRPSFAPEVPNKLLLETPADWLLLDQHVLPERMFKPVSAALHLTFPVTFIGARIAESEISDRDSATQCDHSDDHCRVWLIDNAARHQQEQP